MKLKNNLKRIIAGAMSTLMTVSAVPVVSVNAEESTKPYPYAMLLLPMQKGYYN